MTVTDPTGFPQISAGALLWAGLAVSLAGCQAGADRVTSLVPAALQSSVLEPVPLLQSMEAEAKEDPKKEDKSPQDKLDDAVEKKVTAEQQRDYKAAELELAKLQRDADEIKTAESLRSKREALRLALLERDQFESAEKPLEMRKAELSLERSRDRVLKAATDLANMREIMSEEAEAKNKEEIIRRYEKGFEFAQESLGIQEAERDHQVGAVLPAKLAKLTGAVRAAEAAMQAEEILAQRTRQKSELDVLKAKHAAATAKRKAKKAAAKVADLRRKAEAGVGEGSDK